MGPMKYTTQQRVFIYATFIKTESPKETRKIFQREFGAASPPSNAIIKRIVERFRETGSFEDDISLQQRRLLTEEKLDELCAQVGRSKIKTVQDLALETGLTSTTLRTAAKLLKMHYKIKIRNKKSRHKTRRKPSKKLKKKKDAVPVSVFSVEGMNTIDSASTNDDSYDGEFVLPDDPLADDDTTSEENFVPFSGFKTEMKEEIIIDDDDDEIKEEIMIDDDDDDDGDDEDDDTLENTLLRL